MSVLAADLNGLGIPVQMPHGIRYSPGLECSRSVRPRILSEDSAACFEALAGAASDQFCLTARIGRIAPQRGDQVLVSTVGENLPLLIRRDDETIANFEPEIASQPFTDSKRPLYTYVPGFDIHAVPEAIRRPISNVTAWLGARRRVDTREPVETRYRRLPLTTFELQMALIHAVTRTASPDGGLFRWPSGKRAAFIALHDVDSDGFIRSREKDPLFGIEERHGIKATWFIPTAILSQDSDVVDFLRSAGHEVGWHGHRHDHRDHVRPYADRAVQALLSSRLIEKTDSVLGMRLPKLLKSNALLQLLDENCPVLRYDTSFLRGIAPFALSVNGQPSRILEIPTTVPTDIRVNNEVLSLARSKRAATILKAQIARTEQLIAAGGLISIVTHPEKGLSERPELLDVYDQYLAYIRSRQDVWFTTSGALFSYWTGGTSKLPQANVQ